MMVRVDRPVTDRLYIPGLPRLGIGHIMGMLPFLVSQSNETPGRFAAFSVRAEARVG